MTEVAARDDLSRLEAEIRLKSAFVAPLLAEIARVVVGQRDLVEALLIGLLCRGHVLIEGVPGLAKTLTVNTLATALDLSFRRIQFTPDLLPADLVGTPIYHPGTGEFRTRKGPVFAHLVLADEINRAPAKVQSALLEAMEERQVTLGDETHPLPDPFLVLATQNPLEHEGTYPLPEAQLDRFMLKVVVGYPDRAEEEEILERHGNGPADLQAVVGHAPLTEAMAAVRTLYLAAPVRDYLLDLVAATRNPAAFGLGEMETLIDHGVSPRGSIALAQAARARAFLRGRPYVVPDDVLSVAPMVLRHRLVPSYEAEARGISSDALLQRIFAAVPAP
ncbi:MoxR-like ATPase [Desulfuromonas soudanensis]|uniref:MoxR-like ATPase n=1 Tax=Desulfuromonas soudanensis TaxID=1603606 RepID=A0A0M4D1U3_9BACT|nr:AAA family ATPase [Desulfuromonas soudanensis]ALC17102.1 MoxR-like ATPase [Desulfuromonas soudanensis]